MSQKNNAQTAQTSINLLNDSNYYTFTSIQAQYGIAQRGGTSLYPNNKSHQLRITSDVNLLQSKEVKAIVFENFISKN